MSRKEEIENQITRLTAVEKALKVKAAEIAKNVNIQTLIKERREMKRRGEDIGPITKRIDTSTQSLSAPIQKERKDALRQLLILNLELTVVTADPKLTAEKLDKEIEKLSTEIDKLRSERQTLVTIRSYKQAVTKLEDLSPAETLALKQTLQAHGIPSAEKFGKM